jgi:hypothetical protein
VDFICCLACLVKRLVNAACDEMKCRVAFHLIAAEKAPGSLAP